MNGRRGFTIVELLVVIAIITFIVTIVIVYSGTSRNQITLSVQSAKIAGVILQAKQLAVATYSAPSSTPACGYGVYFDIAANKYSLFVYSPQSAQKTGVCPTLATVENSSTFLLNDIVPYSNGTWQIPVAQGVTMINDTTNCLSASVIMFYPPQPATLMVQTVDMLSPLRRNAFETTSTSYVNLETVDGTATENIEIGPTGQVSF